MPVLTENLRAAYEATDQILANRPNDEFVVSFADKDNLVLYVMAWDSETNELLSGTTERDSAERFTFTAAFDVKVKLDDDFKMVVIMLARDAPKSLADPVRLDQMENNYDDDEN